MPVEMRDELQRIANNKYPAGRNKGNFSQVVLDAIALYLGEPELSQPPALEEILQRLEIVEQKLADSTPPTPPTAPLTPPTPTNPTSSNTGYTGYTQIKKKEMIAEINNLFPHRPPLDAFRSLRWLQGKKPALVARKKASIDEFPEYLYLNENYKLGDDGKYWKKID